MILLGNPMRRPDTVRLYMGMKYILRMVKEIIGLHIPKKVFLI